MIVEENYEFVIGSRILVNGALKGGMPLYKYISNRFLILFQNICLGNKLSEYHTGYRIYSADILRDIDYEQFSDDFIFDNPLLTEIILHKYRIGELSCPALYFPEASSINFRKSVKYGLGVLLTSMKGGVSRAAGKHSLL